MAELPLHPAIVHFPIALGFLQPIIATATTIFLWKRKGPKALWWGVVALQAGLLVSGEISESTGEKERKRTVMVVGSKALDTHESAAEQFSTGTAATAALMAAAAFGGFTPLGHGLRALSSLCSVGVAALVYRAGHTGGELVYQRGAADAYKGATP